ncbi:efflux RND transporter permease subunit [Wenzhouxiangella limi]|uniref:Efflux RND transporter permease subunit n=1 Tax=Wenzhouxiangella limi TaxID=2707351 RepID=A0A845V8U4_9GAMM|nr:efflux RND transporter permease subunit [Wenzhouxiangella limi]NDY96581.1 efflux RND transporter permease subunit [Wenzhouxiangella limi]
MAKTGVAGTLADRLIDSPLVPLIIVAALLVGAYGLVMTPRQDRPDIEVPTALILLPFPGAGADRTDELVARPVGSWAGQLEPVVEVETVASADGALIQVEFSPGISDAEAYGELKQLIERNRDQLPAGVGPETIQLIGEEFLAGLMITLFSKQADAPQLRRLGEELAVELETVAGVRAVDVHGGFRRQIQVLPRVREMAAEGFDLVRLAEAVEAASLRLPAEPLRGEQTQRVRAGSLPASVNDIERIPVASGDAGVIYLGDVAEVVDGPEPLESATLYWQHGLDTEVAAVSLAVSSIPHHNISTVTEQVLKRLEKLAPSLLPAGVDYHIGYDAGRAATETVMSVLENLVVATVVVVVIILAGLGWRAAAGVSIMIPTILSIVPFAYLWLGFTLNPVSIAAMILAIGLIADDTVIMMENIGRHFREAGKKTREITVQAVDEVGNPTILAVLLIVATLLPTAFITGEMGQYTRAIPTGASLAILFSLLIALTVTPYFAHRLLKVPAAGRRAQTGNEDDEDAAGRRQRSSGSLARAYRGLLTPFFRQPWLRWLFYAILLALLLASLAMVFVRAVQLTLVPILDREVFVVELELPPDSSLQQTLAAGAAVGRKLRDLPEVEAYTLFAGLEGPLLMPAPGPPDLSTTDDHRASLYVQLPPEERRERLSFELGRVLMLDLPAVLEPYRAKAWIRRIPSGPSSDNGIEAEIRGPDAEARRALADRLAALLQDHPATAAIERFPKPAGPELDLRVDSVRASARAVVPARVAANVRTALSGRTATTLDLPGERRPVPVVVRLAADQRIDRTDLAGLYVASAGDEAVPLLDVVDIRSTRWARNRHRKDQLPLEYVAATVNRDRSQPISVQRDIAGQLDEQGFDPENIHWIDAPDNDGQLSLFWSGEWQMTRQVYRDLALAGLAVILLIYFILAGRFGSYLVPLLIMMPIPLVFIGVIPGHWLMDLNIAGLGVLGIIALAGIVVRNALLLVDFTERHLAEGMATDDALIEAGVLRTRPILLTAGTVMFGSGALIFEPALKPLGLTLLSGVLVSTLLTLVLIPILYFHCFAENEQRQTDRGSDSGAR